jgi:hypothetical protein
MGRERETEKPPVPLRFEEAFADQNPVALHCSPKQGRDPSSKKLCVDIGSSDAVVFALVRLSVAFLEKALP